MTAKRTSRPSSQPSATPPGRSVSTKSTGKAAKAKPQPVNENCRGCASITVRGARTHNLKAVDVDLPHNQLTVITGVSGSGKSSLAFDTVYAEGQRQYIESLSIYARQFLDQMQRPEVDSIEGLQPTLCIDQRAGQTNPRSTVATVTEIYDYLRLMMARVATPTCYQCGDVILQQSIDQIQATLSQLPESTKVVLMAPVVRGRRGAHRDELQAIRKAGLIRVRVDGESYDIESVPDLEIRRNHTIEAIVDKLVIREGVADRLSASLQVALRLADGLVSVSYQLPSSTGEGAEGWKDELFSTRYACPSCGVSYAEVEPRTFSFNSPYGACQVCDGVGELHQFDPDLLVRDWSLSPAGGAIGIWSAADPAQKRKLRKIIEEQLAQFSLAWDSPLESLKPAARRKLMTGSGENDPSGGLLKQLEVYTSGLAEDERGWLEPFRQSMTCVSCGGSRLRKEALSIRLAGKSIFDICSMSIAEVEPWLTSLKLNSTQQLIARPILSDMTHRLRFLNKVGLGYLTLSRGADTLSGGELQRVRLATSIGSGLVGVCYILDEPSIGLHQRDNDRLIESLRDLQRQGNTVIVVEHDEAMMRASDYLIDMGPGAGRKGGEIVAAGSPDHVSAQPSSITGAYLRGELTIDQPSVPRDPAKQPRLQLKGATLHNLQNVDLSLPLGCLVGITGVSGSGKSSLIGETLVPALARQLYKSNRRVGPYRSLLGFEMVDKLIEITQDPIGRTPRSTPATYCGVFDLIRAVWANTRDAKQRGFSASRFSFNTGEGRCTQCQGQGQQKIEMNFLPDLYVMCSMCNGQRFNRQTLQVRYRDRSIADVLQMSIDEACEFFTNFGKIHRFLTSLQQVGLGYLALGQSSSTLSGGEAQRIKLATELARAETGHTIYFLDEPTTGLHFDDVRRLMSVLNGLVERGNTVIVIEHNLDVIRACDWLIDLGPDGGSGGGRIIAEGTPRDIAAIPESLTGKYLLPA
jgi:excinuclease ABC subunit A